MSIDLDDDILRRHFLAIGTSEYNSPAWSNLPGVPDEIRSLRAWLCSPKLEDRRLTPLHPELARNPSKRQIRRILEENPPRWNDSDAAFVFVTGHGHTAHNSHWLVLKDTDGPDDVDIRSADILRWLSRTGIQHLLVIFDLCNAGFTAYDSLRLDAPFPPTWIVLASTGVEQKAQTGAFTTAVKQFLDELAQPEGGRFDHRPYLRLGDFLGEVQAKLSTSGQTLSYVRPEIPVLNENTPCLPNPRWRPTTISGVQRARRDLAIRPDDLSAHWDPKARGVAETGDPGWLFTGRQALMRHLVEFTRGEPRAVLVTGSAGSGKSAALARLVTLSDPDFVQRYASEIEQIPADQRPAEGAVDVAVRATGKLPSEVLQQICDGFDIRVDARDLGGQSLDKLRQAWWTWLRDRVEPVTIVVDALDEAAYPNSLLVDVLMRLERPDTNHPLIRLLVGVRSPSGEDSAQDRVRAALADRAEDLFAARRFRADREPLWVREDLKAYVINILQSIPRSPYRRSEQAAEQVAEVISAKASRSYLIAQLAATSLARRRTRVELDDPAWLAALDAGVVGVFRDDLNVNTASAADTERAIHLLRAVSFAYGRGVPWADIWPLVTNAVEGSGTARYGDADIAWLLNSRLGGYLITDQEDDTTVYRLFHDSLRTTLRERWRELLQQDPTPDEPGHHDVVDADTVKAVEARIAVALTSLATVHETGGLKVAPPPYVRRHLVEHAHAGGVLSTSVIQSSFLPFVDIGRLREVVNTAGTVGGAAPEDMTLIPVLRKVSYLWDWKQPGLNAAALELWASMMGLSAGGGFDANWRVAWATRSTDRSEIIGRHPGPTAAVAIAELTSGRFVAVAGGGDGVVRMWDLSTGVMVGEPLTGHTGWIGAVATATMPDGRVIAVSGSDDGTVRVWDLARAHSIGTPLTGHVGAVRAVATTVLPNGTPVAVTGGDDRTVRVWDLLAGDQLGPPLTGHTDRINAVATASGANRRLLAVSAGTDLTVRVWDLTRHVQVGRPLSGHTGPISSVATANLPGRQPIAVTTSSDMTLRRWEVGKAGQFGDVLLGHAEAVDAVAVATLPDGRVIAVSGGGDRQVRLWDLATGEPLGEPLGGHDDRVHAVATVELGDGQVLAVTGSDDRTVRLWDLVDGATSRDPFTQAETVYAAATVTGRDGQVLVVTGGDDRTVRAWDFGDGALVGQPMAGHGGLISAVATAHLPDGRTVAVTGGADRTVRLWDLASGCPLGSPMTGHKSFVGAIAVAALPDDRLVAITGSWDYTARIWDLETGRPVGEPLVHDGPVIALAPALLYDGQVVVVTGTYDDGDLRLWDLQTCGQIAHIVTGHTNAVRAIATTVLPDGRTVAVTASSDRTIRRFDLSTRQAMGPPMTGHRRAVRALATTTLANGRRLAVTGGDDRTVRMWDLVTGLSLGDILPTPSEVHVLTISPTGGPRVVVYGDRFRTAVDITSTVRWPS